MALRRESFFQNSGAFHRVRIVIDGVDDRSELHRGQGEDSASRSGIEEGLAARIAQNLYERRFCGFQLRLVERRDVPLPVLAKFEALTCVYLSLEIHDLLLESQ